MTPIRKLGRFLNDLKVGIKLKNGWSEVRGENGQPDLFEPCGVMLSHEKQPILLNPIYGDVHIADVKIKHTIAIEFTMLEFNIEFYISWVN
jgi:hypothetical protein